MFAVHVYPLKITPVISTEMLKKWYLKAVQPGETAEILGIKMII